MWAMNGASSSDAALVLIVQVYVRLPDCGICAADVGTRRPAVHLLADGLMSHQVSGCPEVSNMMKLCDTSVVADNGVARQKVSVWADYSKASLKNA